MCPCSGKSGEGLPFFLPARLIEFEYLGTEPDPDYEKLAEPYRRDLDFAFFAVNLGYSKSEYGELTPREKAFIYKAWENKRVSDTSFMYNAVFTAVYNVNRGKNKRALKLWHKPRVQKADMETVRENMAVIQEVEAKEGKGWIDLIYQKNGLKRPERKVENG